MLTIPNSVFLHEDFGPCLAYPFESVNSVYGFKHRVSLPTGGTHFVVKSIETFTMLTVWALSGH